MGRYGDEDTILAGQGRELKLNPGCARCGAKDLTVAVPVFAAGMEVTFCTKCVYTLGKDHYEEAKNE